MKKEIPIKTVRRDAYRIYLELYKPILREIVKHLNNGEKKPLYDKELDVLACIMYHKHVLGTLDDENMFNMHTKELVSKDTGMTIETVGTHISNLKKKKIIGRNGINSNIDIKIGTTLEINYKLQVS